MTYPTLSISVDNDRLPLLLELLELYRRENHTASRSAVFWDGIETLYKIKCPSKSPNVTPTVQEAQP